MSPEDPGNLNAFAIRNAVPVSLSAIESELVNLWKSSAVQTDKADTTEISRSCSLNLVVYTSVEDLTEENTAVISELVLHHPARTILVMAEDHVAGSDAKAWISAQCKPVSPERRQLCSELIFLRAQGNAVAQLPAMVNPLFVTDVPVYFWWRTGTPFENKIFPSLAQLSDRVLVDSSKFDEPLTDLHKLSTLVQKAPKPHFIDLNWSRVTCWRELVAQFFDAPNIRPHLARINGVKLTYNVYPPTSARNPSQAILFAGWLASRLGWMPRGKPRDQSNESFIFEVIDGTRLIAIRIDAVNSHEDVNGELCSLDLSIEDSVSPALFSISKGEHAGYVEIKGCIAGSNFIQRTISVNPPKEAVLVGGELETMRRDTTYENALKACSYLIE